MTTLYCIDCGREITHVGRCLTCNVKAKKRVNAQKEYKKKQEK